MFKFFKKISSLTKDEILYIYFVLNFKIFYFIVFKLFSYKRLLEISRKLISKKTLFKNIQVKRAFKINKILRNFPLKSTCLHICICEKIMLSFAGINVEVNAGLKSDNDLIEGHAWLTYKDTLISDSKENIDKYQYNHRIE